VAAEGLKKSSYRSSTGPACNPIEESTDLAKIPRVYAFLYTHANKRDTSTPTSSKIRSFTADATRLSSAERPTHEPSGGSSNCSRTNIVTSG
jgi:hypothetical protein